MKTTVALENLWIYLQSLPKSNKKWLSERLIEDLAGEREAEYISKRAEGYESRKDKVV